MARPRTTKKKKVEISIEAITHKSAKRTNIPTNELKGFVAEDENKPKDMLYPRDPTLDPQLVWRGKDEQDKADLAVPTVPVYIQEKIAPKAIMEDIRMQAKGAVEPQAQLFADFNGIQFEELIDFYNHSQNWTNRMILGDSLLVMNSLAEKEGLKGKVQMIYMDPPYGIKFGSNWQVSTRKRDVKDGKIEDASREPEVVKAFRDTWELGIHSYLSYLRDRFTIARDLLTESGSIFVQIGNENMHLVRCILDEIFGSENFCSVITFYKTAGQTSNLLPSTADFIIWYAKDIANVKYRQPYLEKSVENDESQVYTWIELQDGSRRRMTTSEKDNPSILSGGARVFRLSSMSSQSGGETTNFPVHIAKKDYTPGKGFWKTNSEGMKKLINANRIVPSGSTLAYVRFINDFPAYPFSNIWHDTGTGSFTDPKVYVVQTGTKAISRCLLMTTDPGDLVLDPTCGSGTTAFVAEQWGRRWITVDTSRVSLALARTRLMSAKYPYYLLADSKEGLFKEAELTGSNAGLAQPTTGDIRKGFVYKRVPHVTLRSIANNPDIKEGMSREEIDAAIARHADQEMLFDQPYEDKSRIRVAGPFTVESLSPHRMLTTDEDVPHGGAVKKEQAASDDFATMILENLKKAGVQNTQKGERLVFESLEPYAGLWIQAKGEYREGEKTRTVAVCIGPEHGTVGTDLVREAAKEAVQGVGFDMLLVCGFAFDPYISEEQKKYGKLTVLIAKMNPDLAMGDELLKKTGSGNLFMVFGEPDIVMQRTGDELTVEIRGVDVYDPTTGQIRSKNVDDIACWFIDTNYNEESFFVRHAYFCGADKPYDKLKKALRAEVDEEQWEALYGTVSRSFKAPKGKEGKPGKIAVKVINHYGDEVMRVYDVS